MRIALIAAVAGATALSAGCQPKYTDLKQFLQAHRHDVAATSYRIEPPDIICVESPTSPEVDGETQRVRSDGKVSLRLIGDVQVSGLQPREIATKIEDLLLHYYNEPRVTVRVVAYESKNIYAFGQVNAKGAHPFTGRDTLLDLMAMARPNFLAWGAQVRLIRPSANPQERHEIIVDVDKMMETGDLTQNYLLQEGDIVFVPPTPLGWVGLRIQEMLFPVSPALSMYQTPLDFRNRSEDYRYGSPYQNNGSDDNNRRRLLWRR